MRQHTLKLRVAQISDQYLTLQMDGAIVLGTAADPDRAVRGFDARVAGVIHYDVQKKKIDRFDAVATGNHWGEGPFTRNARPGRLPLGVGFELARGESPADRVPPQGSRDLRKYFRAE